MKGIDSLFSNLINPRYSLLVGSAFNCNMLFNHQSRSGIVTT
jgi:hypothetical protein